jgi:hypothetical protein
MPGPEQVVESTAPEPELEDTTEDPREAWLNLALVDMDGGAAALATAARGGRPLPRRES